MKLSFREKKFFDFATVGCLSIKEAYCRAYSHKNAKVLMSCLSREKKARPDLFDAINTHQQELFDLSKKTQRATVINAAKDNALLDIEKREILRQIMTGEMIILEEIEIFDPKKGRRLTRTIKRRPSFYERIRAAELDSKIAGHFAPTAFKGELTSKNGEPLIPKQEIDLSKLSDEVLDALLAASNITRG